jgi:hypothetical protein
MADTYCPGNKDGHEYEPAGNKMSCLRCPRIIKYDDFTRSWKVIQK